MSANEAPLPLIPTGLRDRLPRGLSHPVGAEIISRALAGCPRYDELWIAFGSKPLLLYPAPTGRPDFRLAFSVVCSNHPGTWYLSVKAVPSKERNAVRQLLLGVGLPGVREWLCRPRPETWYEGSRTFQVGYTIEPLRVCFVESLNRRVVGSMVVEV
jgi:hypothetical protein